jgi:PAS domain S-box-containing protein
MFDPPQDGPRRESRFTAEQAARRRMEQLQAVTARLSAAHTPAQVGHATLEAGSGAVDAQFGALFLIEPGGDAGDTLVLEYTRGYDGSVLSPWKRRPCTPAIPGGHAIVSRRPVLLASRAEILTRYPALRPLLESTPRCASAVFPLLPAEDAAAIGFISFDFDRDRRLSSDEVDLLATLARLCAQALERARLYEAEQQAREVLSRSHAETRAAAERVQLALAAGAIIGTWDCDVTTDCIKADERFAEAFDIDPDRAREGITLGQAIGSVHRDDLAGLRSSIAEALARGGAYMHQFRVRGRDGRYRWIEANGRVECGADGVPLRFPGVLLDLEARRAVEADRDRATELLRAFVDAVPGVVYAKDLAGRMLLANRGVADLLGKPPEAFLGKTDAEFLDRPEQAATIMANDRRVMESGLPEEVEEEVSFPDGRRAVWLSTKTSFHDRAGRVIGLIGASVDITARKNAEQALRDADRLKDEFLSILGHELRNPLAPIVTAARLLESEPALTPLGARAVEMIERQSRQLRRLVDDLLEMDWITRGTLRLIPEQVELGSLVLAAAEAAAPAALAKRQTLRVAVPPMALRMTADPARLGQVFENLLGNALKYTPEGGAIGVDLVDDGDAVELRITDDGIGIERGKLESIFELFVQAEPGVGAYQGGLGIGLALARRIVALHAGTVHAESAGPGQGARFVVRLPKRPGG